MILSKSNFSRRHGSVKVVLLCYEVDEKAWGKYNSPSKQHQNVVYITGSENQWFKLCVYHGTTTRQAKRNYRLQYAEVRCSGKNSQINGLTLIFSHSNHHLKYAQRQLIALKLPAFIMDREHQFTHFLVIIFCLIVSFGFYLILHIFLIIVIIFWCSGCFLVLSTALRRLV